MNIVELKFKKTKNLGNYESASLEATAQLEEGADASKATKELMEFVTNSLEGKAVEIKKEEVKEEEVKEEEPKKVVKKKVVKKKVVKKKVVKKKEAPKGIPYDRGNDAHKDEFADILNEVFPNWKDSKDSKILAKETSEKLEGVEIFEPATGKLLESFKEKVSEMMGVESEDDDL